MGRRTQDFLSLDCDCPACGGPLTTPRLRESDRRRPPTPAKVRLCVMCVARALVRATLAVHGEPSPYPESNRCPGHDERMRAHQERVARELQDKDYEQGQGIAART